jgi:hypothetical protein
MRIDLFQRLPQLGAASIWPSARTALGENTTATPIAADTIFLIIIISSFVKFLNN